MKKEGQGKGKLIMIDVQFRVYYAVSFSIHYTDDKNKGIEKLSHILEVKQLKDTDTIQGLKLMHASFQSTSKSLAVI